MPPPLPLTSERLERHGLFLIEDGQTIFLWVGRDAVPQLIIDVFDLPNYETLRGGKVFVLGMLIPERHPANPVGL
jgi:protein transport protein SEC24